MGDVGGWSSYHVGDEAMLAANLDLFRSIDPTATFTVVSADPAFSAAEYGVDAVPRLGFQRCTTEEEREALLARLSELASSSVDLPGAFEGLRGPADGLVISGGGNLTSTWPACIHERLALCRRAAARGAAVLVLGQTIGPVLEARHRELVAEILRIASWIGVRDGPSFALALELGAAPSRLSYQLDDAASLGLRGAAPALPFPAHEPWCGVTLHPLVDPHGSDPLLDELAEQLAAIKSRTGCQLVFIPHAAAAPAAGAPWSDEDVGRALARRMEPGALHLMPIMRAELVAALTAQARMIVSTRYHPIVFGLAAGTPCLGIWCDEYTKTKLVGALTHYGRATDSCSIDEARRGVLRDRALSLWEGREAARQAIRDRAVGNETDARSRRQQLAALIAEREHGPGTGGKVLREADWQAFSEDGFMSLGQVLTQDEVCALQARADSLALGSASNPAVQMQLDNGGDYAELPAAVSTFSEGTQLCRKVQGLETDDLFGALIQKPVFREVCARVYGPHADVSIFRAMVMDEPAGQGTSLPWHQDGGAVWQLDRDPLVTIWVALDPATKANGCMEAIRGSHRLGLLDVQQSTLSADAVRQHCLPEQTVALEVPAGHAIAIHNWVIHRSGVNPRSTPRRAFTMCCMDARTRGLLTGDAYHVVFGDASRDPQPFVRQLREESAAHQASAAEAERYALSLVDENLALHASMDEAARYSRSLNAELANLQQDRLELGDLREENRRLRGAAAQMRAEILALHRSLDVAAGREPEPPPPTPGPTADDWEVIRHDLERLNAYAVDLASRLNATHDSRSWRLTRPMRELAHALRRLRPGASGESDA